MLFFHKISIMLYVDLIQLLILKLNYKNDKVYEHNNTILKNHYYEMDFIINIDTKPSSLLFFSKLQIIQ